MLYIDAPPTPSRTAADRGEPRPAWRLQPSQPAAGARAGASSPRLAPFGRRAEAAGTERACRATALLPLDVPLGHEWANDPDRVASVTVDVVAASPRRSRSRTRRSGLAATIVTEDAAPRRVPGHVSRYGRVLERADALHRRLRADGRPRDRHQRRLRARAARAGHLSRPLAPAVPGRRRRHAAPVKTPIVAKLGSTLVVDAHGRPSRKALRAVAGELSRAASRARPSASSPRGRSRLARGRGARPATTDTAAAAGSFGARPGRVAAGWQDAFSPYGVQAAQVLITRRRSPTAGRT